MFVSFWQTLPAIHFLQTQASTRKWLVEQSLKVPEMQLLEPQVCLISVWGFILCYLNDYMRSSVHTISCRICWFDVVKVHCVLFYLRKILKLEIDCEIWVLSYAELEENRSILICFGLINRRHMNRQSSHSVIWLPLVLHSITRWRSCCWLKTVEIHFFRTSFELLVLSGNDSMLDATRFYVSCY